MSRTKPKPKPKPAISIVGAGRLGTALAIALKEAGYRINALVARRAGRARTAVALLDSPALALAVKQLSELPPSDLVIIATPDDRIEEVVRDLSLATAGQGEKRIALHTSGAIPSTILSPLAEAGWGIGSFHPLVAVSDPVSGARALHGAFWCVEGDKAAVRKARKIVHDLHGESFAISSRRKPLYHAAAVMASGSIVALFDVAMAMLGNCGLSAKEARRVLLPLLASTVSNLSESDPAHALTGTFARGDLATVRSHLKALTGDALLETSQLYRLLGRRALALAAKNGLEPGIAKEIKTILDTE